MSDNELHFACANASTGVLIALVQLGQTRDMPCLEKAASGQTSSRYRTRAAHGLIPVSGSPSSLMAHVAAFFLWLGRRAAALMPCALSADQAAYQAGVLQRVLFALNARHAASLGKPYPRRWVRSRICSRHQFLGGMPMVYFAQRQALLVQVLAGFTASAASGFDLCVASLASWMDRYRLRCPRLFATNGFFPCTWDGATAGKRDTVALAEGPSAQPFTAPQFSTPPEGTVV